MTLANHLALDSVHPRLGLRLRAVRTADARSTKDDVRPAMGAPPSPLTAKAWLGNPQPVLTAATTVTARQLGTAVGPVPVNSDALVTAELLGRVWSGAAQTLRANLTAEEAGIADTRIAEAMREVSDLLTAMGTREPTGTTGDASWLQRSGLATAATARTMNANAKRFWDAHAAAQTRDASPANVSAARDLMAEAHKSRTSGGFGERFNKAAAAFWKAR